MVKGRTAPGDRLVPVIGKRTTEEETFKENDQAVADSECHDAICDNAEPPDPENFNVEVEDGDFHGGIGKTPEEFQGEKNLCVFSYPNVY